MRHPSPVVALAADPTVSQKITAAAAVSCNCSPSSSMHHCTRESSFTGLWQRAIDRAAIAADPAALSPSTGGGAECCGCGVSSGCALAPDLSSVDAMGWRDRQSAFWCFTPGLCWTSKSYSCRMRLHLAYCPTRSWLVIRNSRGWWSVTRVKRLPAR
jgi:hypothetical protein